MPVTCSICMGGVVESSRALGFRDQFEEPMVFCAFHAKLAQMVQEKCGEINWLAFRDTDIKLDQQAPKWSESEGWKGWDPAARFMQIYPERLADPMLAETWARLVKEAKAYLARKAEEDRGGK